MKSSLQSRIANTMWLMTAFSIFTAAVLTGFLLIRSHRESIRNQLEVAATSLLSLGFSDFEALEDFDELNSFIEEALEMEKVNKIVRVFDETGRLVFSTVGMTHDPLKNRLRPVNKPVFLTLEGKERRYESLVLPYLVGKLKKKSYTLQVAIPLPRYTQIVAIFWWQSLLLMGLLMGMAFFLSRRLSRRLMSPVAQIANHLEKMDPQKIEKWKPLELGERGRYLEEIIRGINALGERTRSAVLQIRKMGRYVAHELRTPLTILQGEAEMALSKQEAGKEDYEKVLKSSLEEIQRMSGIVTTVLGVGEEDKTGLPFHPVSCDLNTWVLGEKPLWEKTLGRPLNVEWPPESRSVVRTDLQLLHHLIDNLIRNVRDHTPPGTSCTLKVISQPKGCSIRLSDNGRGMAKERMKGLNLGLSGEVSGIGLHLCHKIAALLNLHLHFENRPEGGLVVEIGEMVDFVN